jgi:hypothetical protein
MIDMILTKMVDNMTSMIVDLTVSKLSCMMASMAIDGQYDG